MNVEKFPEGEVHHLNSEQETFEKNDAINTLETKYDEVVDKNIPQEKKGGILRSIRHKIEGLYGKGNASSEN